MAADGGEFGCRGKKEVDFSQSSFPAPRAWHPCKESPWRALKGISAVGDAV
jgi:hypothetical protein